jgi:hypothetical protein
MSLHDLSNFVSSSAYKTFERADAHTSELLDRSVEYFAGILASAPVDPNNICITVIGSAGRHEALDASDFDLLPVARDADTLQWLLDNNKSLRGGLADLLNIDVSTGRDLLKSVSLNDLTDPERIGGDKDGRTSLTQRILILTEASQAGGEMPISELRRQILGAYAHERTAGRHPLAFCNDLARYYRTVCIDYKGRVDTTAIDWCTRNVKLRHSRKVWYFASLIDVASISKDIRPDDPSYVEAVLLGLELPPVLRLFRGLEGTAKIAAGRVLDQYAWFLEFMADEARRDQLASITHERRYDATDDNPFPALQWNSKVLHSEMIAVLDNLGFEVRDRIVDWFLL